MASHDWIHKSTATADFRSDMFDAGEHHVALA
jgi:hypothetical protein